MSLPRMRIDTNGTGAYRPTMGSAVSRSSVVGGALAIALSFPTPARACDSNGCYQMTRGDSLLRRGAFRVDLSYRSTDQSLRLLGSEETDSVRGPKVWLEGGYMWPGFHEELSGRERFLQLDAAYGLRTGSSLFASVPLRTARSYSVGHGGVTQQYRPRGLGDTLLGVRHAIGARFVSTLGVKLPSGESALIDGYDGTILDPMLQPGTGSVDVLASLAASFRALAPGLRWTAAISRQQSTASRFEYRFGHETIATLGARRAVRGPIDVALQAKLFDKGRSAFHGEPVASTGVRYVYLTPGLHVRLGDGSAAYALLPVPVRRHVNEAQLAPRRGLVVGFSRTF
jgi:hypothetical protein